MDFAKTFDKVSHTRLLHKLHMDGIDTETCRWSRSFLCGRTQCVVVDGEATEEGEITSGVRQGSVLGSILFQIYINDMAEYIKHSSVRLFADDTSPSLQKITAKNSKKTSKLWRGGMLTGCWNSLLTNALSSD